MIPAKGTVGSEHSSELMYVNNQNTEAKASASRITAAPISHLGAAVIRACASRAWRIAGCSGRARVQQGSSMRGGERFSVVFERAGMVIPVTRCQ